MARSVVITCACKTTFNGITEMVAWEAFQRHIRSRVAMDDYMHGVTAVDPVEVGETPVRWDYPSIEKYLVETLRWVAQVSHEEHHHSPAMFANCSKLTCMAAAQGVRVAEEKSNA